MIPCKYKQSLRDIPGNTKCAEEWLCTCSTVIQLIGFHPDACISCHINHHLKGKNHHFKGKNLRFL